MLGSGWVARISYPTQFKRRVDEIRPEREPGPELNFMLSKPNPLSGWAS